MLRRESCGSQDVLAYPRLISSHAVSSMRFIPLLLRDERSTYRTKVEDSLEAVYDDADLIAGNDMDFVDTLDSMDCSFYLGEGISAEYIGSLYLQ